MSINCKVSSALSYYGENRGTGQAFLRPCERLLETITLGVNGGSETGRGLRDGLTSWKFVRCFFPRGLWRCKVRQKLLAAALETGTGFPPSLKSPWLTCRLKHEQVFHRLATTHGLKPCVAFIDPALAESLSTYATVCVWLQPDHSGCVPSQSHARLPFYLIRLMEQQFSHDSISI